MKLLKRFKWVFLGLFFLFVIIAVWIGKDFFLSQDGALYGNRLEGIEKVPITNELKKDIKDFLLSNEGIKKVNTNVHGKIFIIVILVDETIIFDNVIEYSIGELAKCSDEQKGFYDIAFLVDYEKETDKKDFPKIGSKSKNSNSIVW